MRTKTLAIIALMPVLAGAARAAEPGWAAYGGDPGGTRFSAAHQITPANVAKLKPIWSYSTGDLKSHADAIANASFENTPILAEGRLYVCSTFDEVSALDPGTGKQLWRFDPKLDSHIRYPNDYICRAVAFARVADKGVCAARIFLDTADRRLIALDASTGKPCAGFGSGGTAVIPPGPVQDGKFGRIHTTSGPLVSHGLVIVGSSIDDNQKIDELRGAVHAFDAITGKPVWHSIPSPIRRPRSAPAPPMYGHR